MPSESGANSPGELLLARLLLAIEGQEMLVPREWLYRQPEAQQDPSLADEVLELHERLLSARGAILPQGLESRWPRGLRHRPGEMVGGEFELVRCLGAGGMGEVWEAHEARLDRSVALKLMRSNSLSREGLERFSREARAGARLNHPGIVMTFEHRVEGDSAWIALELVRGDRTLRDFLAERSLEDPLPPTHDREVAGLVAEIADALAFAHERGVIHRDVKPANVLLTPDDRPKVTDFGLAQVLDDSLTGDDVLGTYAYMSPEQVQAQKEAIDHRTDVFSLGVVLYELLTLRKPFQGDTRVQVANKILLEDPPDPRTIRSRIPLDLTVIAGRALEKDRDKRFQSMDEFAADLRRYLANEPILSRPPSAVNRLVKWTKRNPAKSVAAGIASVTFTIIALLLAENIRANRSLEAKTLELETKSLESEERRIDAQQRADQVLRLSALQRLEDLTNEAEHLWPAHPENIERYERWLERAEALVAELPDHEEKLAELRKKARPWTTDELAEVRATHPRAEDLERLEREIAYWEARTAVMESGEPGPDPTPADVGVDFAALPPDASGLNSLAWPLVDPGRTSFGGEREGLVLARRAVELAGDAERAGIRNTLAWALLALARYDEAVAQEERAIEEASGDRKAGLKRYLDNLYEAVEAELEPEAFERTERRISELEAKVTDIEGELWTRDWTFDDDQDKWWHNQLEKLVRGIRAFADEKTGLYSEGMSDQHGWGMKKRLANALSLRDDFGQGGKQARAWENALPKIRAAYPGLALTPQLGLVPIGPDPKSKLWEFAHLETGEPPERNDAGSLILSEETGIVLVLLQGGLFEMGAQAADPLGNRFDPAALGNEGPVTRIRLAPFFMSKYEMTQAQWVRLRGHNPSRYPISDKPYLSRAVGPLNPVENVSWFECSKVLGSCRLQLPTDAQWEYAARGGTNSVWWTGNNLASTKGKYNCADAECKAYEFHSDWKYEEWSDGYVVHSPVGSYDANPFGLYDMMGNVCEWCRDDWGGYDDSRRLSDGYLAVGSQENPAAKVWRSSSFFHGPNYARSAHRALAPPDIRDPTLGVRPVYAADY